jgi:hypothetical protein
MNTHNAVSQPRIRGRSSPFRSLFGAVASALLLTAALAPRANAATNLLTYYNFEQDADLSDPPFPSSTSVPFTQSTTLTNDITNSFPSGNIFVRSVYPPPPPPSNISPAGTTQNQWPGGGTQTADPTTADPNHALDLAGNANVTAGTNYCFEIGPINTVGSTNVTLSFAIASVGNGGQFDILTLAYSTTGAPGTFTHPITINESTSFLGANTSTVTYHTLTANLDSGANNQATLYIQFCFQSTSGNNAHGNDTLIDNIRVEGEGVPVPEPTTAISGVLAVVGLCWYQRRWLIRSLRLRPA